MHSVVPLTRKKRGHGPERRGEILEAAKRLFIEEGYPQATMRRIAGAVGVSATALYVYFPDKDSILQAIAEKTFEDLLVVLHASQDLAAPALARARAGLEAYIAFGRGRPDEYRLTFLTKMIQPATSGPNASGEMCDRIEAADRSFFLLADTLGEAMRNGQIRAGEPVAVAEALWACAHGLTAILIDHRPHLETEPDVLVGLTLDAVLGGLAIK
jgi:AcrR family transcriptional regulator